jgi:hypothetical protein
VDNLRFCFHGGRKRRNAGFGKVAACGLQLSQRAFTSPAKRRTLLLLLLALLLLLLLLLCIAGLALHRQIPRECPDTLFIRAYATRCYKAGN